MEVVVKKAQVGIIGGSGLYEIEGSKVLEEVTVDTPWGAPSDSIVISEINGEAAAFLQRGIFNGGESDGKLNV